MEILIAIAFKSLVIAGLALGLLALMRKRSAAERSWVAHIGLVALIVVALAPLILPKWNVEAPALLGRAEVAQIAPAPSPAPSAVRKSPLADAVEPVAVQPAAAQPMISPAAAATAAYAVPAAILLFITLLALVRLVALRARADVLVDGHWLSALARAQRRMGFKHGTALLTSDELASPISWGLMRPVILLNTRAVEASGEAEAIIAHELAHVARMDWIKLLLARIATALFWFNPLVWVLAREAHQLREEAADDAVLAADIADTDYAELLVGVARHECPGLLLGAHGVAPSKGSLARRVARVLDVGSVRGPVARSFAFGVFAGAMLVAAPLAALTLTPAGSTGALEATTAVAKAAPAYGAEAPAPTDLPNIIAQGVSTAVAAVTPATVQAEARPAAVAEAVAAADKVKAVALAQAVVIADKSRVAVHAYPLSDAHIDRIIELKTSGVTADYVNAMQAAAPSLRRSDPSEFVGMRSVGVTPQFARDLVAAGFRKITAEELTEARAIGMSGDYARSLAAAGVPPRLDAYVQLRAVGVPAAYVHSLRRAGYAVTNADKLVEMYTVGVGPADLRLAPPVPPRPPVPPPRDRDDDGDG